MLRSTFIEAPCEILQAILQWRESGERLLRAMDDFEFADVWEKVVSEHNFVLSQSVHTSVVEAITDHRKRHFDGKIKQKKAA